MTTKFSNYSKVIEKMGEDGRDAYSLLRHLYKITNSKIVKAGKLVLRLYNRKLVGSPYEHELRELVSQLYVIEEKELANSTCIAVSETVALSLKELYNKNN